MTKSLSLFLAVALTASIAPTAPTGPTRIQLLDPNESRIDLSSFHCADYLELVEADDGGADVRTVWAHGYYSALRGYDETSAPVTVQSLMDFVERLTSGCEATPGKLWIHAVKELA